MRHHLGRSRRRLFSVNAWKVRLVFWAGALLVGGTAALFAVAAARADHLSHHFLSLHPLLPFVVIPLGFTGIAWLTRRVFPGSQGSDIPQAIAALSMRVKKTVLSHMATSMIAYGTSHLVCPESLYHSLALGFLAHDERPPSAGVR